MPWKQGPVAPVRSYFTKRGKERRPDGTNIIENEYFIYPVQNTITEQGKMHPIIIPIGISHCCKPQTRSHL